MKKFFRTWIDWWLFIPVCIVLSIGCYWFVPWLLGEHGLLHILTGRFIPEHDMQYTGTAWIYDTFKAVLIFFLGSGVVFAAYRFYIASLHKYFESELWDAQINTMPEFKAKLTIAIPALLFFYWCLICIAVFK